MCFSDLLTFSFTALEGEEVREVRDQAHTQTHSRMHTGWRVTTHRTTRDALSEHLEGREGWKHVKHALIERGGEME